MNRPLLLRITPPSLRLSLYYRFYRHRRAEWKPLYEKAPLHFAPGFYMNLWTTDEGHGNIAFTGCYELDLSHRIALQARNGGGLMLDVGANYGYFSLLWAAGSVRNRVIAFEASPRNHAALRSNVSLNGLESRIDVRECAAGREAGRLSFSLGGDGQTGWGGFSKSIDATKVEVPVVTLDDSVCAEETVQVLKIDVEGADTWVLYGAKKLLKAKRIKNIFFEHNREHMERLGITESEATSFLEGLGYDVHPLGDPESGFCEYYASPAL